MRCSLETGRGEPKDPIRPSIEKRSEPSGKLGSHDEEMDEERIVIADVEEVKTEESDMQVMTIECQPCDEGNEQSRKPLTRKAPYQPTAEEIREHAATHLPYRSWCPECVRARGKATGHQSTKEQNDNAVAGMHVDYWFMRDKPGGGLTTVANLKDDMTKSFAAHVVPHKGNIQWVAEKFVKDIERFGHKGKTVTIKSDQEPALMDLVKAIKDEREEATLPELAKTKDSQSNGLSERAVQSVEGMVRTHKLALEKKIDREIPSSHPLIAWLVEHCAFLLNKYLVSSDGRTPHERVKGKKYRGEVLEFWPTSSSRGPGKVEGGCMAERWSEGYWIGKVDISDEHMLVTLDGKLVKARSIQLKPENESWDADGLDAITVTPWKVLEKEPQDTMKPREKTEDEVPEPVAPEAVPRDIKINAEWLRDKYGYTKGCPKCIALRNGKKTTTGHNKQCRERVMKRMEEDEEMKAKVDKGRERINEYLARRLEEEDDSTRPEKKVRVEEPKEAENTGGSRGLEEEEDDNTRPAKKVRVEESRKEEDSGGSSSSGYQDVSKEDKPNEVEESKGKETKRNNKERRC